MGILSSRMRKILAVLTIITLAVTPVSAEEIDISISGSELQEESHELQTGFIPMYWDTNIPMPEEDISWGEIVRK